MRRAVLLYNPRSGRGRHIDTIERVADALRSQHIDVSIVATEGPNTAGKQAAALANTIDILFACGDDGTIHEVVQGLAHHPTCTLGIVPLGSANALARHLRLGLNPIEAALQQLSFKPHVIPLGHITYTTRSSEASRYFLVMAGAGPDGALVYNMLATQKRSLGRLSYYVRSAHLFATSRFSPFVYTSLRTPMEAVSVMAVRVRSLGGLFGPLVAPASLEDQYLTVTIAKAPARLSLPAWFAFRWARLQPWHRFTETLHVSAVQTGPGLAAPVQVQADGEHLGTTPMSMKLVPDALRLLMPPSQCSQPTAQGS